MELLGSSELQPLTSAMLRCLGGGGGGGGRMVADVDDTTGGGGGGGKLNSFDVVTFVTDILSFRF